MRQIVIGVIGGGEQPKVALDLGEQIALARAVLLTGGGQLPLNDKEAKDVAIRGASGVGGRYVGVLPLNKSSTQQQPYWRESIHSLLIGTNISSEGRDPINGMTPDVGFVLQGGRGTLCELAFALAARRKPLFVGSARQLLEKYNVHSASGKLDATLKEALKHFSMVGGRLYNVSELKALLGTALSAAKDASGSVHSLVHEAIQTLHADGMSEFSGFPSIPGIEDSKNRFERWLQLS